ncbi:hypothetical protein L861_07930 [Litchfieldella anticariensis FP35 = DSM 16096]|uniref:Uncharacterized protein n=1 Tax=Litchfieldella anticariensis (strain DSM 16096 / CECT 5854 / CIP 108499 / LMG 22089 / FP35) TaxID=1121939 RepID=S2L5N1_LITA3|nr:MBL fold metallo-hydrolase [Halomonas anticariensis]EPC00086.1 hypothetical protein L861_07930 [Halomonas anticariensis FP35 = DSM 16096]
MRQNILPLPEDHPLLALIKQHRRALLVGAPGSGKSTLVAQAAATLEAQGISCHCLSADPGSPGFGPPGAVCLGSWYRDRWYTQQLEALCTLDAARFRLPLIEAVRRLASAFETGFLLVDPPGVVRGTAGAELLPALADASGANALAVLTPTGTAPPLSEESRILGLPLLRLETDPQAHYPGRLSRSQRRTNIWNDYLKGSSEQTLNLETLPVIGTPPPQSAPEAWHSRQVGLLDAARNTLSIGEVMVLDGTQLRLRAALPTQPVQALLVRDAHRDDERLLTTARPYRNPTETKQSLPELVSLPRSQANDDTSRPVIRLGMATATLVNGVYGDPALHIRLRHHRRSLLFDLGDVGRLPARLAHQITDVFITHAHFDHIAGFLWLLRSRIGEFPPCRIYGPPGLAQHLAGMVRGVLWDRVGDKAPRFEVSELHEHHLQRYYLVAGQTEPTPMPPRSTIDGVLIEEPWFRVRAITLDHGTPVLAFSFEPCTQVNVRKERLSEHGWPPGPWLGELKYRVLTGELGATVTLPDGHVAQVRKLKEELLLTQPGQRLVYATDLGDTPENRRRLIDLAREAQTLVCEAPFLQCQADQAMRTRHLTARACGEIAAAAHVERLLPFHFSRRHTNDRQALYDEIRAACPQAIMTSNTHSE